MLGRFADDPGRHRALAIHNRRLERIDQGPAQALRQLHQQRGVDEIALRTVQQQMAPTSYWAYLSLHSDGRGQTAEEQPAGLQYAPHAREHRDELGVVT